MARRDDILGVSGAETVIGSGVKVKGTLAGEGDMTIDGTLTGDIKTGGVVTLGVNASIRARVTARGVTVAGHLEGDIFATDHVAITESGQVRGNITAGSLSIATGAIFIGTSIMRAANLAATDGNTTDTLDLTDKELSEEPRR